MIIFKYRLIEYIVNDMFLFFVFWFWFCYDEFVLECLVLFKMDEDEMFIFFFDKIFSFLIVLFFVIFYLMYYFFFVVKVSEWVFIGFLL